MKKAPHGGVEYVQIKMDIIIFSTGAFGTNITLMTVRVASGYSVVLHMLVEPVSLGTIKRYNSP